MSILKKTLYLLLGLLVILIITILAVGPLESVLFIIKPHHSFESDVRSETPDYSKEENWAALPTIEDPSDLRPEGILRDTLGQKVNVFYIHPTGYLRGEHWNSMMDLNSATEENTKWMLANQASVFNDCQVYAPRYREATIFAFFNIEGEDETAALELAYQDVASAFDYFINQFSREQPFIIASHSQGTRHAMQLIKDKIDQSKLAERMIAAYIIGMSTVTKEAVTRLTKISVCTNPTETNCIIHWATFQDGTPPQEGWDTPMICVNPLSWKTDETRVEADANLGYVASTGIYNLAFTGEDISEDVQFPPLSKPVAGHTMAYCKNGRLMVEEQVTNSMALGPGNYHGLDFQLFHMNIRKNVVTRITSYFQNIQENPIDQ